VVWGCYHVTNVCAAVGGHIKRSHEHQMEKHSVFTNFHLGFRQHKTYNINYALMQHVSTRRSHHQATLKPY